MRLDPTWPLDRGAQRAAREHRGPRRDPRKPDLALDEGPIHQRHSPRRLVLVALALSACGSEVTQLSPSTPVSSSPHATPTSSPAASTIAPASPAQTLSPSPSAGPSTSSAPLGSLRIPYANREMEVTIVGEPGIVVAWRAATDSDLQAIAWDGDADIALGRLLDRDLVLLDRDRLRREGDPDRHAGTAGGHSRAPSGLRRDGGRARDGADVPGADRPQGHHRRAGAHDPASRGWLTGLFAVSPLPWLLGLRPPPA